MSKVMKTARELGMAEDELSLIVSAIYFNQVDALRELLDAGVHGNVSSVDILGLTPLHHAALHGHAECVQLLLRLSADPDVFSYSDDNCNTPLHHAARIGNLECIQLLIEYGANIDVRNLNGESVTDILRSGGHRECIAYIRMAIDNRRQELERAKREDLFDFVKDGNLPEATRVLASIEDKADAINRVYRGAHTLLHKASYCGHIDIVRLLLDHGANGRANPDNGSTPLYAASSAGHLGVVRVLAERLPNLLMEPTTNDRSVPLHEAAIRGNTEVVKYLLKFRPKIESSKTPGNRAKSSSTSEGLTKRRSTKSRRGGDKFSRSTGSVEEVAEIRVDTSIVNVNVQNKKGLTPLHFAVMCGKKEVVLELLKCTPIIKGPVKTPHPSCLAIDISTKEHKTALYETVIAKNLEMAELLLANGADPNHFNTGSNCLTPLQIACRDKRLDLVKMLLKHKADPNKWKNPESSNLSPLNIVCANNCQDIAKLLMEHGAKDFGECARDIAAEHGFDSLVEMFLSNGVFIESEHKIAEEGFQPVIISWSKRQLKRIKDVWLLNSALNKNTHMLTSLADNPLLTRGLITRLDLSANRLTSVPVSLFQLPSLRRLNLSENSLTSLSYGSCEDRDTEDFTWNCPLLEELELQNNQLAAVPNCLFDLPKLKNLFLFKNCIKEMPFKMWKAPCLKELLLQDNQMSSLPVRPKFARGPSQFNSVPNTQKPRSEGKAPKSTPNMANKDTDNVKSKRPSWDGESDDSDDEEETKVKSGLTKLDISNNKNIGSLPEQLPCLAPDLTKLTAAGCGISNPVYISSLPAGLAMLDLSRNRITKFDLTGSEPIGMRRCLSTSHSRASKTTSAPEKANSRHDKKLCSHCSHDLLIHLTTLNISRNQLEEIRFIVTKQQGMTETLQCVIPNVHTLNISHNLFRIVPPNIQKIKKLGHLEIIGNTRIDSLPPELGMCLQLYELKFNPQQMRYPPKAIIEKKRVNGQIDIQYIRRYLKQVCEQARPYPNIKLMFVGRSRKGKSTLLQQLRKEGTGSYLDPDYQQRFTERMKDETIAQRAGHDESTVGVDLCDWTYQKRQFIGGANAKEIKFSTWDFAGQEEYYATHTCFLSKRAIYVLVWKLTDGYEGIDQLESWLLNIQARAQDAAVVIVGTHYDEMAPQTRKELIDSYRVAIKTRYVSSAMGGGIQRLNEKGLPRVLAIAEVSCKNRTEHNIRDLRNIIYETATSLKDSRNDNLLEAIVPASYIELEKAVVKIAQRLRKEKKYPVLDTKQFRSEVRREFERNSQRVLKDDELDDAVQFIHECGVLLHFDDPSLKDQYFIDPQWLCDMLANVITVRDVNPFKENGVLKVDDLRKQIFRGQRFSSSHVDNYIELMNKFEVAIKVAEKYLLVPSFLPERQVGYQRVSTKMCPVLQQAMNVDTYLKHKVFRRQYLMAYVPSGFWARLITRLIADERISKIVASCMEILDMESESAEKQAEYKESLACTAPPEWGCWKNGVELSCFEVKLMRVCQLDQGELFYGHDGRTKDKVFIKNAIHDYDESRTIEILVPSVRLGIGLDAETQAFRLVSVQEDIPQTASELLTLAVEHIDNLLADWFSTLDTHQTIHGDRSVRRVSLCPDCLTERIHRREEVTTPNDTATEEDSGCHNNTGDANSNQAGDSSEKEADGEEPESDEENLKNLAKDCINGFDFEEAVKSVDEFKPLICHSHGEVDYKKVFLDVMFEDLPESFLFTKDQVQRTKFIASGSYGAVFKGTLTVNSDSRVIAIKVPHNTDACGTKNTKAKRDVVKNLNLKKGALTMFTSGIYKTIRQELSILVPVSHKHIVELIGVAFYPLCLLIEFAPKGSLNHVLSQYSKAGQKLDSYAIQQCILQVADALRYLHERNIIYRDLKSENVLVWSFPDPGSASASSDIYLKLADYGISRPVAITGMRGYLGTPGFMAPEIIKYKGKETYSKKVDAFSFGSFIYELITRKLPFGEVGEHAVVDQLIVEGKRPKVPTRDKRIPVPILSLLYKCWEHDPKHRPSQAEIYSAAKLKEFPRMLDDLEYDNSFKLQCALTTSKRGASSIENCADSKDLIGSELWLCSNEDSQEDDWGNLRGEITVLNYSDGKCNNLKKIQLRHTVVMACVVGSTVWLGTKKGAILVYCSMTFKPLALAKPLGSRDILSILHSLACHCVVVGSIDGSIMSYSDKLSSHSFNVSAADVKKYFGDVEHNEPIKEMIHNRVFTDSMTVNPIVCLAAVPSRANHSRMEDTVKYFGSGGEPVATSSRGRMESISSDCEGENCAPHPLRYELWCGLQRGLITILDLEDLEKVHVLSGREGEINNPAIKQLCVTRIETKRVFQTTCHPQCPAEDVSFPEDESASVWVVLYPGTCVYRWNVDKRKIEAKFDAALQKPDNELNSFKSATKQTAVQVSNAQILTVVVVEDHLYLGTTFGCMIVCDSMSLTPLSSIRCYIESLDYLIPMQMTLNRGNTGQHKEQLVLASGRNCLDKWNKDKRKGTTNGNQSRLLTWYADQWHT